MIVQRVGIGVAVEIVAIVMLIAGTQVDCNGLDGRGQRGERGL